MITQDDIDHFKSMQQPTYTISQQAVDELKALHGIDAHEEIRRILSVITESNE